MNTEQRIQEFDRQVRHLQENYPVAAGISLEEFNTYISPLRQRVETISVPEANIEEGKIPFVIVVRTELVETEKAMTLVVKDGKHGVTKLTPFTSRDFETISEVGIPQDKAYLLVDIDRGKENLNLAPNVAMDMIKAAGRSPLTIDEGIAIVTHFPEALIKNNCFSLLASRKPGSKHVPAIWINGDKHPNLGWCWDGNPHTWLGSASCGERVS